MKLDFDRALKKKIISQELSGNNPVPDILGFLHVKHLWGSDFSQKLKSLLEEYEQRVKKPRPLLKINVPKANFTIRPMARPDRNDWLIYEAITDYLSKKILKNTEICKRSYSILNFKTHSPNRTDAWLKFDDRSRDLYRKGYKYAVITDITGYYENISLEELRSRVINYLGKDVGGEKLVSILFHLLRQWSIERIEGYGLPQGPPASSFLADIFLDHVDRIMEQYEGYFRYMDDVRIFCKQKIEAKLALKDLTIALMKLKLNINAKKTDILCGKKIEEKLFDPQKPLLDMIEALMKSKDRRLIQKIVIPGLLRLFEDAFSNDAFEKRHLNFALYRLGILHVSGFDFETDKITKIIQKNFVSKPHHAGLFCDFLSIFPKDEEIARFLISFLKSEDNIYEWQELKVLQTLLKFNVEVDRSEIDFFINSAQNSHKHYAVRAFYFLLGGKYGNNRDRDLIVDCHGNSLEIYTKMAIILAVQGLGQASRNNFYSRVKRSESDESISEFIDYVKSLQTPIYYLTTERPKIETYEKFGRPFYESI